MLGERGRFAPRVRRVLDAQGLTAAPVQIVAVHAVDLDGDSGEELIINAAKGDGEGEDSAATDYSMLLLADRW